MIKTFLRVHFPHVERIEVEPNVFFSKLDELVHFYSHSYYFAKDLTKSYELLDNGNFKYIEETEYIFFYDNIPYEYGFFKFISDDEYDEDSLDPEIMCLE